MSGRKTVLAWFTDESAALEAVRDLRRRGLSIADVYTPYPVHGLDEAMGLKPSRLPVACFAFGAAGALTAFLFQTWIFEADWPVNIGGKPFFAWPSFIPVTFEMTVLFAGLGSVASLFLVRKMFPWKKSHPAAARATDDRFIVAVEKIGTSFDERTLRNIFLTHGAMEIKEHDDAA